MKKTIIADATEKCLNLYNCYLDSTTEISNLIDIKEFIAKGLFSDILTDELLDEIIAKYGKKEKRVRKLTTKLVIYVIIMMGLYPHLPIEDVLKNLSESAQILGNFSYDSNLPKKSAISQKRKDLGVEVIKAIAQAIMKPLASSLTKNAFFKGMQTVALDGTLLDVKDTPKNESYGGKPKNDKGEGSNPQIRVLALLECGTRAIVNADVVSSLVSERKMSIVVADWLKENYLVLADRGFYSYKFFIECAKTKANLYWRVKKSIDFEVCEKLDDGSYISYVKKNKKSKKRLMKVRVVEYTLHGTSDGKSEIYRLVTTILDPQVASATELAQLYHERWEIEVAFSEIKTAMFEWKKVLRSKTPENVKQEIWGLLIGHYMIRKFIVASADKNGLDPDTISFKNAIYVIKRRMNIAIILEPKYFQKLVDSILRELSEKLNLKTRNRCNPRVVKKKFTSSFPVRKNSDPRACNKKFNPIPVIVPAGL